MTMLHISKLPKLHQAAVNVVEAARKYGGVISSTSKEIFELQKAIEKIEGKEEGKRGPESTNERSSTGTQ